MDFCSASVQLDETGSKQSNSVFRQEIAEAGAKQASTPQWPPDSKHTRWFESGTGACTSCLENGCSGTKHPWLAQASRCVEFKPLSWPSLLAED